MRNEVIVGERVRLVPTGPGDLDLLTGWWSDPEVYAYWGGVPMPRDEVAAKYTGARRPDVECFMIESAGRPVGFLQHHVADDGGEGGGLDMFVLPAWRRSGIGRDAVTAVVCHLREERGWNRVTVDPDADNERAVAFWQAVGFTPERRVADDGRSAYWLMRYRDRSDVDRSDVDRAAEDGHRVAGQQDA